MDLPQNTDDVLAQSIRARLFQALVRLRRPATTQELAAQVGRHPNSVRVQLQRLADVGLLERRDVAQPRGRPRQEWAIAAAARPAGRRPQALEQLSRWLARAAGTGGGLEDIEAAGQRDRPRDRARSSRSAGRRGAPRHAGGPRLRPPRMSHRRWPRRALRARQLPLSRRGRGEPAAWSARCTAASPAGLLERLDRKARLTGFRPKDPYRAGCLVDVTLAPASPGAA